MKYLTQDYWNNFKKDGKLFEQLSKVLIEYEFNQKDFYIVGGPGDGGSDIKKEIQLLNGYENQIWAQCKYYHRTLSFDDISFTLLMAYLKNTNQILIFSYSKVSLQFTANLNEYITRTGKNVILYADEELETLILKHQKKLLRYHGDFFPKFPAICPREFETIKANYQLYIDNVCITNQKTVININSICEFVITITNPTLTSKSVRLSCVKNKTYQRFSFIKKISDEIITVPSMQTVIIKLHAKLKEGRAIASLPEFELKCEDQLIQLSSNKKLILRWLADTVLIGNQYYSALKKINDGIKMSHFHLIYIYGKSGVGKSRILKEAQEQSVRSKKRIIYIDPEKKEFSSKKFIELLCSKITLLPIFNQKLTVLSDNNDMSIAYATRILYDESYDIVNEFEKTVKFLAYLMTNEDIVLSLDNLQSFDKLSLEIVEQLTLLLKNMSNRSTILVGINTDYMYINSSFYEFYNKMRYAGSNNPEYYTEIPLDGFEPCDSELYIRECLSCHPENGEITSINYEKAIQKIAVYCGNNPFYIQQYLLYLYQKGILKRSKNTLYYFSNIEKFLESFSKIPPKIENLITERENLLLKSKTCDFIQKYQGLIYLINITKSLPLTVYSQIIGDAHLLNLLFDIGFLTFIDGLIVPIHSYFSVFFTKKYLVDEAPDNLLEKYIKAIDRQCLCEDSALTYFWAKYRLGIAEFQDLQLAVRQINTRNFDCLAFDFCLKPVCTTLWMYRHHFSTKEYVLIFKNICTKVDETLGIKKGISYYTKFFEAFQKESEKYAECVEITISVLTSYLIHLINLEQYERCEESIAIISRASANFNYLDRIKTAFQINRCKIMICNRNNIVKEAIILANDNLCILDDAQVDVGFRNEFLYSAQRSIGNTYFYSTVAFDHRKDIVESWNNSFNSFVKVHGMDTSTDFSFQPKVAACAKGLAADMISGNELAANKKVKYFMNAFDRMHMMYYEMQIRLLIAIYLTWKWSDSLYLNEHIAEINKYIDQTIDIAAIYGRTLTTINAFHLRGVVYFLANRYALSIDSYGIATKLLTQYLQTEKDFERWEYFWVDYARVIRKCNETIDPQIFMYIKGNVRNLMKEICSMNIHDFEEYEDRYKPMTALTDKDYKINFPKI